MQCCLTLNITNINFGWMGVRATTAAVSLILIASSKGVLPWLLSAFAASPPWWQCSNTSRTWSDSSLCMARWRAVFLFTSWTHTRIHYSWQVFNMNEWYSLRVKTRWRPAHWCLIPSHNLDKRVECRTIFIHILALKNEIWSSVEYLLYYRSGLYSGCQVKCSIPFQILMMNETFVHKAIRSNNKRTIKSGCLSTLKLSLWIKK